MKKTPRSATSFIGSDGRTSLRRRGPRTMPAPISPIRAGTRTRSHNSPNTRATAKRAISSRSGTEGATTVEGIWSLRRGYREGGTPSRVRGPRRRSDLPGPHEPGERREVRHDEVRLRLRRIPPPRRPDERGHRADRLPRQHILRPVPDHPRVPRVHAEVLAPGEEHPGTRLPARASVPQLVRTPEHVLDSGAGRLEPADHRRVDRPHVPFRDPAPRDAVLVRDHGQAEPRAAQGSERGLRPPEEREVLGAHVRRLRGADDRAVAVEEGDGTPVPGGAPRRAVAPDGDVRHRAFAIRIDERPLRERVPRRLEALRDREPIDALDLVPLQPEPLGPERPAIHEADRERRLPGEAGEGRREGPVDAHGDAEL